MLITFGSERVNAELQAKLRSLACLEKGQKMMKE